MEKKIYSQNLEEDKEYLGPGFPVKFVIIQEEIENITKTQTTFFLPKYEHSAVTEIELKDRKNSVFVGAGRIRRNKAEWDSSSCDELYGYYKPSDSEVAVNLLSEIEKEVLELLD